MRPLWRRLPLAGYLVLILVAAGATAVVMAARSDLATRDPATIRGDVRVWQQASRFPGGAAAYLIAGRRKSAEVGDSDA